MRSLSVGVLVVAILLAAQIWLGFVTKVQLVAMQYDETLVSSLHLDDPEFKAAFRESWAVFEPSRLMYLSGGTGWFVLAATAVIVWLWSRCDLPGASTTWKVVLAWVALVPAVVGAACVPSQISENFKALAEQGLTAPEILGSGVGESFTVLTLGLEISIVLLAAYLTYLFWTGRRSGESPLGSMHAHGFETLVEQERAESEHQQEDR